MGNDDSGTSYSPVLFIKLPAVVRIQEAGDYRCMWGVLISEYFLDYFKVLNTIHSIQLTADTVAIALVDLAKLNTNPLQVKRIVYGDIIGDMAIAKLILLRRIAKNTSTTPIGIV